MTDILDRPPPPFDERVWYGPDPQNFAEFRVPNASGPFPLLFVIHGGFWRAEYDLSHIGHLCAALTTKGIVTCNLEYRRVGHPGGGWPGTFQDLNLATNYVLNEVSADTRVDVARVAVLGHSAGGHLALWLTSQNQIPESSPLHGKRDPGLTRALALAPVCDLQTAWRENLGNGAVARLLGGSPDKFPDRYHSCSPIELLPNGSEQILVHGTADGVVPASQSEKFAKRARQLGDHPTLIMLSDAGHFELIDPESEAWSSVVDAALGVLDLKRMEESNK